MEWAWLARCGALKARSFPRGVHLLRALGVRGTVETGSPRDKILLVIERTPVLDRCTENPFARAPRTEGRRGRADPPPDFIVVRDTSALNYHKDA